MDTRGIAITGGAVALGILVLLAATVGIVGWYVYKTTMAPEAPAELVDVFESAYVIVSDDITTDPVASASVKLSGPTTISKNTDSNGQATFVGLPSGTYTVTIKQDNYYWLERTGQSFTGTKSYVSKSYSITRLGVLSIDNSIYASNRSVDNTVENTIVEFGVSVSNTQADSKVLGAVLTLKVGTATGNLEFENIEIKTSTVGGTLTTVTEGKEYQLSIGDLTDDTSALVVFDVGISGIDNEGYQLPITISVDDTPPVEDDTGVSKASKDFTITIV